LQGKVFPRAGRVPCNIKNILKERQWHDGFYSKTAKVRQGNFFLCVFDSLRFWGVCGMGSGSGEGGR
jgi:hypothetical protein